MRRTGVRYLLGEKDNLTFGEVGSLKEVFQGQRSLKRFFQDRFYESEIGGAKNEEGTNDSGDKETI